MDDGPNKPGLACTESGAFATTQWTAVLSVSHTDPARAAAALEELCRKYWYPAYAFLRRQGHAPHEAEDLTQGFFAFVIETEALKKASRERGKFRTFLLTALTNFLRNEWDKAQSQKRGGGRRMLSLDEMAAEEKYRHEPVDSLTPEKLFERRWALTLIEQVLERLKEEYFERGQADVFKALETGLTGEVAPRLHASWAESLNMSEGAVRVALHRLRRRFGELLRHELGQTVTDAAEIDDELRHLFRAMAGAESPTVL